MVITRGSGVVALLSALTANLVMNLPVNLAVAIFPIVVGKQTAVRKISVIVSPRYRPTSGNWECWVLSSGWVVVYPGIKSFAKQEETARGLRGPQR